MNARLILQRLESREVPAFIAKLVNHELRITFNNDSTTAQSVEVSAVNGRVTLNEKPTKFKASNVWSIKVTGSDLANFLDLRFVSTGTGFRPRLNGHITVNGGQGDDVLVGSAFGDKLNGGDGFDQLMGANGNDTLDGGAGVDWLYHGYGDDVLYVGAGDWYDRLEPGDRVVPA